MRCLRRVQKLEARVNIAVLSDPLRAIRDQAFDLLDPSDRMFISHLARRYAFGEDVEESKEISECFARWGDLVAALGQQNQGARGWL